MLVPAYSTSFPNPQFIFQLVSRFSDPLLTPSESLTARRVPSKTPNIGYFETVNRLEQDISLALVAAVDELRPVLAKKFSLVESAVLGAFRTMMVANGLAAMAATARMPRVICEDLID